ncbi:aldo-keto reductase [Aureococcus anophagefferens]|uniref:Aldo-keto reductase n=1 Tax=Aureococcus anophagefferens TaxID=44056 RepID=A0ABR1G0D4_AURAN
MGAEVAVLETRMLGAKERVLVEAEDGTKGWGSRSVFERCPETRVATPRTAILNTGRAIPLLGFGTWKLPGDAKTKAVVRDAIRAGYRARPRHIDTARMYSNEAVIGEAIAEAVAAGDVTRDELFVTTKLWNSDHGSKVEAACRASLARLKLDYVDLWPLGVDGSSSPIPAVFAPRCTGTRAPRRYLVHCPFTAPGPTLEPPLGDTWREMTKVYELGLARAVGVSNFSLKKVDALEGLVPAVLQVELHPLLRQTALLEGCAARGIHVTAYSPLGSADSAAFMKHDGACGRVRARFASAIRHREYLLGGKLLEHADVAKVARSAGCTPAQALLKYGVQRGCSVLPKSSTASRIAENADIFDAPLSPGDMEALGRLEPQTRFLHMQTCVHPKGPYKTLADFWDE